MPTNTQQIRIGSEGTVSGTEHKYLRGYRCKVIAVFKGEDYIYDNETLARKGGVAEGDRIEVTPWMGGRWSFATSDPRAVDFKVEETA